MSWAFEIFVARSIGNQQNQKNFPSVPAKPRLACSLPWPPLLSLTLVNFCRETFLPAGMGDRALVHLHSPRLPLNNLKKIHLLIKSNKITLIFSNVGIKIDPFISSSSKVTTQLVRSVTRKS